MKNSISLVLPVYNESGNLNLLHERISSVLSQLSGFRARLLFVNDGSSDDSLEVLKNIAQKDPRVEILNLSKNYGHQIAVIAGLDASNEDVTVIMDTDLQDPPELILEMVKKWEDGADVVYAQRRSRQDGFFKKQTAKMYYRTLNKLSAIEIPKDTGDFRLMDKAVVSELQKYREHNPYIRGIVSNIGFRQEAILFDRDARFSGKSGYTFSKMLKLAFDGIMSFSVVPLKIISVSGVVLSVGSILLGLYFLIMKFISPSMSVQGWTYIVVGMLFLGGVQLVMLGVIGSYVGRTYIESLGRPLYSLRGIEREKRGRGSLQNK